MNPLIALGALADRIRYARNHDVGRRGEDLAHRWLRRRGFIVVARNWRPPQGGGEIDLVAWDKSSGEDTLVFVEVKSRVSSDKSSPERAIDPGKIRSLRRAARDYARRAGVEEGKTRFDAIAISRGEIEYLPDAFGSDDSSGARWV